MRGAVSARPSEVSVDNNSVALQFPVARSLVGQCIKADDAAERGRPKLPSAALAVSLMHPLVESAILKSCA